MRLHNKSSYNGSGLGLAIVKKIINIHGGDIWVESTEHQGSTFYFTLKDSDSLSHTGYFANKILKRKKIQKPK